MSYSIGMRGGGMPATVISTDSTHDLYKEGAIFLKKCMIVKQFSDQQKFILSKRKG